MLNPKIIKRNKRYGNNYWRGKGRKVNLREVTFYSDLEYDHWVSVEMDFNVITYCEQPSEKEISYVFEGELRSTLIDMWVLLKSGIEEYREVKYTSELRPGHRNYERNMRQIGAQRKWCEDNGLTHRVIDETMLRTSPYIMGNRVKLLGYINNTEYDDRYIQLLDFVQSEKLTLHNLIQNVKLPLNQLLVSCSWLTYKGIIDMDITSRPISLQTEVWKHE